MTSPITTAMRLLAYFWLEELTPNEMETIAALPELAETLSGGDAANLTSLAVDYQRLFGFNLPPYESIFIDPTAMLQAPATERVQALYRQAGWTPPPGTRTGAPDQLGLELLALADWSEAGQISLARQLHTEHLALWLPPFVVALRRLAPPPFYATLAELTLDLLLTTLPDVSQTLPAEPFPDLPPPPVYRGSDEPPLEVEPEGDDSLGLRRLLSRLLVPREAGLYLSREEIARISRSLDLPVAMGERYRMLETLFRSAGQYELVPALVERLTTRLTETEAAYQQVAEAYPHWQPYAAAWVKRLGETKKMIEGTSPKD